MSFLPFFLTVERQSTAIRAIRDVEIEHLLTELHLLCSKFSKEQLPTPTLQFFKENFPNLSIVRTEGKKQLEVQWNDEDSKVPMNHADERDIHASLLRQLSMFILTALLLLHLWVALSFLANQVLTNFLILMIKN